MRLNDLRSKMKTVFVAAAALLLGAGVAGAQQQVNLSAGTATATMPDGTTVPMWGYSCGAVVAGSTASCAALSPKAAPGVWSPVVITVPTGQGLQINLTNNLPPSIPTSLMIAGQLGGGLGTPGGFTQAPNHGNQGTTWPIANSGAVFTPPAQANRVRSFGTEVSAGGMSSLTWTAPREGTYLMESGTHPSIQDTMGLIGMVVVTAAPADASTQGIAYAKGGTGASVTYNAEVPLIFSEIDPVQNNAVKNAVNTAGFSESATLGAYEAGPVLSISVTNGGSGYTSVPTVHFTSGSPTATATAVVDTDSTSPTYKQVTEIDIASAGAYTVTPTITLTGGGGTGAAAVAALQLQAGGTAHCSGGASACYPPVVNYKPLYYLINGLAFDKTNASNSLFAAVPGTAAAPVTGTVLVRMVNAGSRMHIPAIVGSVTGSPAIGGFSLIAEDGNPLPGTPRVQNEVFMAAGKAYDVMINAPTSGNALPVYDRELSLSANATSRDAGMLAYISVNGSSQPTAGVLGAAVARADSYSSLVAGQTFTVSDPSNGVIANDTNVYGVTLDTVPGHHANSGTVTLNANGTFTYVPSGSATSDTFGYCVNGTTTICAMVSLGPAPIEASSGIVVSNITYNSNVATYLKIAPPGVLSVDKDGAGYPLTVAASSVTPVSGLTLTVDPQGGFNASVPSPGTYTFTYQAQNSQGTKSVSTATVTLVFPTPNGPAIYAVDGQDKTTQIKDYRWIIEEDKTFYIDPTKTTNAGSSLVPTFGTNFHTSYMPVVAAGCTGDLSCESGQTLSGTTSVVCDLGNGACRPGTEEMQVDPTQVHLDPTKRYYITLLPGDAANPFLNGNGSNDCLSGSASATTSSACGHGMGGAPLSFDGTKWVNPGVATLSTNKVTVLTQPTPFPPAKLAVFVFEDDFPLNGEVDSGGGVDVLAPNEPGLGGFNITIFDDAGGSGDATGQVDYDMFNQPLSNSLAGSIDPSTGRDACPISAQATASVLTGDGTQKGVIGQIVTCPKYESGTDSLGGKTLSPLAGQAIVANMMPGRYGIVATPAADRIARGEEWLQTNTLDGQKAHDSFLRIGEAGYFQEYGPAGYHVSIGFANPKIINDRLAGVCSGSDVNITGTNCKNTVTGVVTTERMSRTPDERLYSSGNNSSFGFTQCYASVGDPDGEDFAFTKCDGDGRYTLTGIPDGSWRVTVFDQWNDMLVDGLSTPVNLGGGTTTDMGDIATNQWQANIYTSTFFDQNGNGVRDTNEPGLALVPTNVRFRDGSFSNFNNTDLMGNAGFNEEFPLFSWYVVETDATRYKNTGTHVVYDAGGPADGSSSCGDGTAFPKCGSAQNFQFMANTNETVSLPANLRVPGAVYCDNADCGAFSIATGPESGGTNPASKSGPGGSTGRIDPPWVLTEGWQGFSGQNSFLEFGKTPYAAGENGGIRGHVVYASTRPFDDPQLLLQLSWEPLIPNVTINLYKEGTAPDGSQSLTLIDTTKTSSFDDWAQGFRSDGIPSMNCPGQATADTFYFTLFNQPNYLNVYDSQHGGPAATPLPLNAQFKCYDGMHNWNQLQPAPYDGMYQFPSVTAMDPVTGKPTGTNCSACTTNPDSTDPYRYGLPMLPDGKYVVEVVPSAGYELVKEEDKNILIGDNFIAPVTVQFPGVGGSVFIMPDQAEIDAAYNANNAQNSTTDLGRTSLPSHESDTGTMETYWPCVGASRIVPDYISLFPGSQEVAPFAGATRNLCDRKEVTLGDQTSAQAKFYLFTSAHVAAHYTGVITDDFTSEFDPFSPQFGEKFAPPDLPISLKDWTGNEVSRIYTDQWGAYNGLTYSTWEVNPPNPTGYSPQMMVTCMNDPGTGTTPDVLFNPGYSQFCYEIPFMPGQTQYMDTPVTPTTAFSEGYNHPDCAYPDATPAVSEVDGDGIGPWVGGASGSGSLNSITVTNQGSGYTGTPLVSFSSGGGSGAVGTAIVSASVDSITLTTGKGGSGYTSAPTVAFIGGGGSGAAATATISGNVTSATITAGGLGYTSAPTVNFDNTGTGGSGAVGTAALSGAVTSAAVANGGRGYTGAATVSFNNTGTHGTGAAATANMTGSVSSVTISNATTNSYSSSPTVAFSAPSGGGTTATGTVQTSAAGAGRRRVTGVTIVNPGSGYTGTVTATFSGATCTTCATPTTVILAQSVASVTITNGGSGYTIAPSVTFSNAPTGGSRATGTATESGSVIGVTITNQGSGYNSAPAMSFTGGGGTGAAATANVSGKVTSLTLTAGGSGYTSVPTVTFLGGGGTGAAATDTISGKVVSVILNNPGQGYSGSFPVAFSGGGGSGAAATASVTGGKLTIRALGDLAVLNNGYSGPSSTTAPYNQKTVTRHYGFGTTVPTDFSSFPVSALKAGQTYSCNGGLATGVCPYVTVGGQALTGVQWSDATITGLVPTGVPACNLQQQAQFGGSAALCGQLLITTANGRQSIDSVTVTIGGKAPTHVITSGPMTAAGPGDVQKAIDGAAPGDLIMIDPGVHNEMLLMWKPVRLQGVGAASSVLNANTQPAGKLDQWRQEVNCLFGLALNGQPYSSSTGSNPFATGAGAPSCPATGWNYFTGGPNNPQVDRLPLEGVLGWDTTVNGNLAQLLQEPTLMGAYEGAGITVLSKGVNIPTGSADIFGSGSESAFPTGTTLLTNSARDCGNGGRGNPSTNPYSSNFQCNPSSIDGISITDSSQGGGGIYVHAWGHNLQIANNRIYNNSGTLTGGITIGQGESPDAYLSGDTAGDSDPGSCQTATGDGRATLTNTQLPYCFDLNVNVHNNSVSLNASIGDELYSSTPAGGGGVTFCTGADYYKFNYNWVCGNLSTGDGGGLVHLGYIYHGDIENNSIVFNEATNPTVPTNGGGIIAMGAPPDGLTAAGLECGNTVADADCVPGLSDGTGPGLVINANLIMGNAASSGSGGGLRFQGVNGTDVVNFPLLNNQWNNVTVTNNVIANNIAGWDGAGVSLQDALNVNLINNTIASNDTTASAGVLFNTLGAPLASSQGPTCTANCGTTSAPQPAGLVAVQHSAVFASTLTSSVLCPTGHGTGGVLGGALNGACKNVSYPLLDNNVFWQNRSFYIGVNGPAHDLTNQQNQVALFNAFTHSTAANQPQADATANNGTGSIITGGTGACVTAGANAASFWDIGVRGDTGPTNHSSGHTLAPTYSVITDIGDYNGASLHNTGVNPTVVSQYCNGSRTPPEVGSAGYQVPPGISDATVPNPIFNLTPAATVDEGNNWVNISWGPLAMTNPSTNKTLGNYGPASTSSVINLIPSSANGATGAYTLAPSVDFFGNPRKTNNAVDAGAVEFVAPAATAIGSVTGGPLVFGSVPTGTTSAAQTLTLHNTGTANLTGITVVVTAPFFRLGGTCGVTLTPAAATCTVTVVFSPTALGAATGTASITANVAVTGSPVGLSGTGVVAVVAATLTPASHNFGTVTRNCPGTGLGVLACAADPAQAFTLTNTGNVTLAGIAQGVLGGTNANEFGISRVLSSCGPNGGGQVLGPNVTLAPGGTCTVTVQFKPLTAPPATNTTGTKNATVSVTDAAGTQTSTLTGTAN